MAFIPSPPKSMVPMVPSSKWLYHAYSLWLFTRSDLKTIVFPNTIFGLINAVAVLSERNSVNPWATVILRSPKVAVWVWINLIPFAIDNQRRPASILEDKQNKPWRVMPSRRMTESQAKALMICLYSLAFYTSLKLGGIRQYLGLLVLGYGYNELGLADRGWISRNIVNSLGYCSFASGALEVALGRPLSGEHSAVLKWLGIIAGVVFSTVQMQDMADQVGDSMRGRKSMPLMLGDGFARWLTAGPVLVWSALCPIYCGAEAWAVMLLWGIGLVIAGRTVACRSVDADKRTFRLWNAWMACLYALPLLGSASLLQ